MADLKVSGMTEDVTPTVDDLIATIQDPGGTPLNRKVTLQSLLKFINGLTANAADDRADVLTIYDSSGAVVTKITVASLFSLLIAGDIPNLDAAKITSGTIGDARLPGTMDAKTLTTFKRLVHEQTAITYAASTELNFDLNEEQTISLTGNITLTTANRAAGKRKVLKILCDGTQRTLGFPAWKFMGAAAPANIAASKTAILSLTCFGIADTDIVAAYAVEP